jgi:hypothetical protein
MKKLFRIVVATFFLGIGTAQAGTVGMSGSWDFEGMVTAYDSAGNLLPDWAAMEGSFNFTTGYVNLYDPNIVCTFFGYCPAMNGTVSDNGDGTYDSDMTVYWSFSSFPAPFLWDITDLGDGTATLFTLDGDDNGIPGTAMTEAPFLGISLVLEGTLTAVPVPAAVWLFGSGLIGLIGIATRKKS